MGASTAVGRQLLVPYHQRTEGIVETNRAAWHGVLGTAAAAIVLTGCGGKEPDQTPPDRAFDSVAQWAIRLGDSGDEQIADVVEDGDGNLLAIGSFLGTTVLGEGQVASQGGEDAFLFKLDTDGGLVWSRYFGSAQADVGYGVATDAAGNVYAIGAFSASVDFGGGALTAAGQDGFVIKLDPTGGHLWSRQIGGAGDDWIRAVSVTTDGDVVVAGSFVGTMTVGSAELTSAGDRDVFVVGFDTAGDVLWSTRFGGSGVDVPRCMTSNSIDQHVVTGAFDDSMDVGDTTLTSLGGRDAFVVQLSPQGRPGWTRSVGGAADDELGLCATTLGGGALHLSGSFIEPVDLGGGQVESAGEEDIFVAKWSADSSFAWAKTFGDPAKQIALDVAVDDESHVHIAGQLHGRVAFRDVTRQESGGGDALAFRLSPSGNPQRSNIWGDAAEQRATVVTLTADGFVVVAGEFYGAIDLGTDALTSFGERDLFVAKVTR